MTVAIDFAKETDAELVLELIRALADYEKLAHEVVATLDDVRRSLFVDRSAECLIAREDNTPVGFAIFFHNYSTFLARRGIWLEDLFVKPEHRGKGHGRALLVALAKIAVERRCGRLEWAVLDWNEPALAFYGKLGARSIDEWRIHRLVGDSLTALARS